MTIAEAPTHDVHEIALAELVWPIKAAFVAYIERMKDGVVTIGADTRRTSAGAFAFPLRSHRAHASDYGGAVQFTGHYGMLWLRFEEIAILTGTTGAFLTVADPDMQGGRRTILSLGESQHTSEGLVYPAPTLTTDGAELFFDNYRPGTVFDPVTITGPHARATGSAT